MVSTDDKFPIWYLVDSKLMILSTNGLHFESRILNLEFFKKTPSFDTTTKKNLRFNGIHILFNQTLKP